MGDEGNSMNLQTIVLMAALLASGGGNVKQMLTGSAVEEKATTDIITTLQVVDLLDNKLASCYQELAQCRQKCTR